jgi:hypothetical protein
MNTHGIDSVIVTFDEFYNRLHNFKRISELFYSNVIEVDLICVQPQQLPKLHLPFINTF